MVNPAQKIEVGHENIPVNEPSTANQLSELRQVVRAPEKAELLNTLSEYSVPQLQFAMNILSLTQRTSNERADRLLTSQRSLTNLAQGINPEQTIV